MAKSIPPSKLPCRDCGRSHASPAVTQPDPGSAAERGNGLILCACGEPLAEHHFAKPCPVVLQWSGGVDPILIRASRNRHTSGRVVPGNVARGRLVGLPNFGAATPSSERVAV